MAYELTNQGNKTVNPVINPNNKQEFIIQKGQHLKWVEER